MSDELKPCPACRQPMKQVGSFRWFHPDWPCVFNGIQIEGPGIHEWNRVADQDSLRSKLAIAVEALEKLQSHMWEGATDYNEAEEALARIRS